MTEQSYQEAIRVLKDRLGTQWEGAATEGRSEMARILRDELGYDQHTANHMIDAMINEGKLRYHDYPHQRSDTMDTTNDDSMLSTPGNMLDGASAVGGLGALPLMPGVAGGHWEVNAGDTEEPDAPGRKGQVTPH